MKADMEELEIDRKYIHYRKKWRQNVMKRKTNPIGKYTLNNTVAKGFNQMAPPARTITVALDMSKAFDTITHTNQKAATDKHSRHNH